MKFSRRAITVLAAILPAILIPLSPASAAPAPAVPPAAASEAADSEWIVSRAEGPIFMLNAIVDYVKEEFKLSNNRTGLVQSMELAGWYKSGQKHNVIVMLAPDGSTSGRFTCHFDGIIADLVIHHDGYPPFRLVVFKSGKVTNDGDGGYINWAYRGWFKRTGMTVVFHQP